MSKIVVLYTYNIYIMTSNNSQGLLKLEQEILREFKRLSFGEETKLFDYKLTQYQKIPQNIPQELTQHMTSCIILSQCSCFEIITFAVMELIFNSEQKQKNFLINKIKSKICEENFLFGSGYIKGLLIKGMKKMIKHSKDIDKPIANYLQQNQALTSFHQFWKQIIEEESQGELQVFSEEPDINYFKHISKFLGIGFKLHLKELQEWRLITINPTNISEQVEYCSIIIQTKEEKVDSIIQSQSLIKKLINYIILLPQKRKSTGQIQEMQDLDKIMESRSEQYKILKTKAWQVKQKGNELIRQFHEFWTSIKSK